MMRKESRYMAGFTLIELILYVALVAVFITGAVMFTWDIVYGREKAFQQQIVDQSARVALERIAYEIRSADGVVSVSVNQIILNRNGSTTTISLVSNAIQLSSYGSGPYNLTSNQVRVSDLTFTDLSSSESDPLGEDSRNIYVSMTLEQAQGVASGQLTTTTTLEESIELHSQFNQSRRLLIDLSGATLAINTSLQGITIQNTGTDDIVVDKLKISWQGTAGGENLTEVQIGGGAVEWSGFSATGDEIDIADFTLTSADGIVDVDYLDFDSDMSGAKLGVDFILSDLSTSSSSWTLEAAATPTPTPTPVYSSCAEYCIGNLYSNGTCRRNAKNCTDLGEVYQSGGDKYCTGGPNADTCCCLP